MSSYAFYEGRTLISPGNGGGTGRCVGGWMDRCQNDWLTQFCANDLIKLRGWPHKSMEKIDAVFQDGIWWGVARIWEQLSSYGAQFLYQPRRAPSPPPWITQMTKRCLATFDKEIWGTKRFIYPKSYSSLSVWGF